MFLTTPSLCLHTAYLDAHLIASTAVFSAVNTDTAVSDGCRRQLNYWCPCFLGRRPLFWQVLFWQHFQM